MTVSELIDRLNKMPEDAEVFYGQLEFHKEPDGLPVFSLFDFEPVHYPSLRSCRSSLPRANSVKDNVVVFEYD